ncbi:HlyC/CorC family transporter [Virgibacillus sp. MSP4-1]|nr:HlyC/CorC family transporter [Virgibacillus sp. MSP4-1]
MFLLITLIGLSAFFSSSETAFSSVNHVRLRKYVSEGRRGSKRALKLVDDHRFDQTLSTILVGNNIVNVAAASISAKIATDLFGGTMGVFVSTVVMTTVILIFGEILPKSLAKEHAEAYALMISNLLYLLTKLLIPVNFLFLRLKWLVSGMFSRKNQSPSFTEEELKVILGISEKEGVIDKIEQELIRRSLNLDEISVKEIVTPRSDMVAIDSHLTLEEIKNVFFRERYSRIPVYEGNIDHIIGFLTEREFLTHLLKYQDVSMRELLRDPLFVAESTKISTLLSRLQKNPLAIVVNEFGETTGMVTLEDILEEIIGEILDENEKQTRLFQRVGKNEYLLDAQYNLRNFADIFNVSLPETAYYSLGGWIMEHLETIPSKGDSFPYEQLLITVEEVAGRRVKTVRVRKDDS